MLEQEAASIIRFIMDAADSPTAYFHDIPESFMTPSVYFPEPEIETDGDTTSTYLMDYSWFIMIFGKDRSEAYDIGLKVTEAIRKARNGIPVIASDGSDTGRIFRIKDPDMRLVDSGACRLYVRWSSRRYYPEPEAPMSQETHTHFL